MPINQSVGVYGDTGSIGGVGSVGLSIDPMQGAGRVSLRPLDHTQGAAGVNVLGQYRIRVATTAIAPTGGGIMSAFRWVGSGNATLCALLRVQASMYVVTAVTAQRADPMLLKVARSYTATDSTAAVSATVSGNNGKMRTSMATTAFNTAGNIAATNNTAGQSGGTSTLDSQAIGSYPCSGLTAVGGLGVGLPLADVYRVETQAGEHPQILAANEGVQLLFGTTTFATGTVIIEVIYTWAELSQY